MKRYLISHDLGTSGDKAALFTLEGEMLRCHTAAYPLQRPAPGCAEQDPQAWWEAFCLSNRAILAGIDKSDVAGICLTGQMMCCLCVDRNGFPLHPAMIWADSRAETEARLLAGKVGEEHYYETTGMRASANYGLPKMLWLKTHHPELYERTHAFLNPKDYINWKLTGRFATDPESAAFLHCYDWREACWSQTLLDAAGVSAEKLPAVLKAGEPIGTTPGGLADICGLPAGVPVVMGPGDGGAATLGAAVLEAGEAYTSLGTSSWVCAVSGTRVLDPKQRTAKLNYLDTVRDSGTMQAGGYARGWMEQLFFEEGAGTADLHALADGAISSVPAGAGGVLFLPYLMGERAPIWDTRARAGFLGVTAAAGRNEFSRSVLEGVALHLSWILDCILETNSLALRSMKMVGGGAKSMLWNRIFADIYNMPVTLIARPDQAGALGTAVTAGVGLGLYTGYEVIRTFQPVARTIEPDIKNAALYRELKGILQEAYAALRPIHHRLQAFKL